MRKWDCLRIFGVNTKTWHRWSAERAGAPLGARNESLRANTAHVVPVVAIVVVGIQTRAIPVQVVAIRRAV